MMEVSAQAVLIKHNRYKGGVSQCCMLLVWEGKRKLRLETKYQQLTQQPKCITTSLDLIVTELRLRKQSIRELNSIVPSPNFLLWKMQLEAPLCGQSSTFIPHT